MPGKSCSQAGKKSLVLKLLRVGDDLRRSTGVPYFHELKKYENSTTNLFEDGISSKESGMNDCYKRLISSLNTRLDAEEAWPNGTLDVSRYCTMP